MAARVMTAAAHLARVAELTILLAGATAVAQTNDASSLPQGIAPTSVELPTLAELEAAGAVIGRIGIENENIFDLNEPEENRALYRLANRMHIRTRPSVIREQLLLAPGERFSQRKLEESERILRTARYLYDAEIRPVAWHDGVVDLRVTTRDVWTLNPGLSFGRQGGRSTTGFSLEEANAFGTGITLALSHESGVDRDSTKMQVKDPHFWDGRTVLDTSYSDTSDGRARWLTLDHPFYSFDGRWALGTSMADEKLVHSLYDLGKRRAKFLRESKFVRIYGGTSQGLVGEWVQRWTFGATFDDRRFDIAPGWDGISLVPEDRKLVYPWIGYELLQDRTSSTNSRTAIRSAAPKTSFSALASPCASAGPTPASAPRAMRCCSMPRRRTRSNLRRAPRSCLVQA